MNPAILCYGIITAATYLFAHAGNQAKSTPQDVIKKYERYVREMRADSLVQLFTSDAEIGHEGQPPIRGRDSIYRLLASLTNVKVINNRDSVSNVFIREDSAIVNGNYSQTVVISGKDTINVTGLFTSNLILDQNKRWLIWRMHTRSN
jgi:hypothetical protein